MKALTKATEELAQAIQDEGFITARTPVGANSPLIQLRDQLGFVTDCDHPISNFHTLLDGGYIERGGDTFKDPDGATMELWGLTAKAEEILEGFVPKMKARNLTWRAMLAASWGLDWDAAQEQLALDEDCFMRFYGAEGRLDVYYVGQDIDAALVGAPKLGAAQHKALLSFLYKAIQADTGLYRKGDDEIKVLTVTLNEAGTAEVRYTVGRKNDEGTAAEVWCRTSRQVFITKPGGISAIYTGTTGTLRRAVGEAWVLDVPRLEKKYMAVLTAQREAREAKENN